MPANCPTVGQSSTTAQDATDEDREGTLKFSGSRRCLLTPHRLPALAPGGPAEHQQNRTGTAAVPCPGCPEGRGGCD